MSDHELTDEERGKQLLARFIADLWKLCTSEPYGEAGYVVLFGQIDVLEGMARRALRENPAPLPHVLSRLDLMRRRVADSVETTLQALQPFDGRTH